MPAIAPAPSAPPVPSAPAALPVAPLAPPADVPTMPIYRLSVEQYHRMIETGILPEGGPIELLRGWLVQKMPKNPSHPAATRRTRRALEACLGAGWLVDAQEPITTSDSEPEPDIRVVRGPDDRYFDRHPGPEDIGMLVEVSESTLRLDSTVKMALYAEARIPIYWIVNLVDARLEVYTQPSGPADAPRYLQVHHYGPDDVVPIVLDGQTVGRIAVRDLLP